MECVEKIFEISTHEYHGGFWKTIISGNISHREYIPSPRKQYIQAVRNLSYILKPFYDEEMEKQDSKIFKQINQMKKEETEKQDKSSSIALKFSKRELILMERLFCELNLLLKRKDYLKGETYEDELEAEEEEGEEIKND